MLTENRGQRERKAKLAIRSRPPRELSRTGNPPKVPSTQNVPPFSPLKTKVYVPARASPIPTTATSLQRLSAFESRALRSARTAASEATEARTPPSSPSPPPILNAPMFERLNG